MIQLDGPSLDHNVQAAGIRLRVRDVQPPEERHRGRLDLGPVLGALASDHLVVKALSENQCDCQCRYYC